MIRLYEAGERYFTNNGIKNIRPLKAIIYKEDNGDYYLEMETSLEYVDFIKQDMILRVDTPWGKQGFRCDNPTKTHNKIKVKAWHLFYDAERYTINNSYVDGYNCAYALDHLNNACDQTTPFSTSSDITTMASCRVVRKSLAEGVKHVVEVWGGHLYRDNWNIAVRSNIGQDRGVTLAYGKNIKQLEAEENWDIVCTKILPVGNDGVTLDEIYLESDVQYDVPYTRVIPFDQDIEQGEEMSDDEYKALLKADLRVQAESYLEKHLLPEVNYTLKAHLTNIADIGDTIFVKHPKCNIDIETHVISVQWDAIKKQYKEIEFGNFKQSLSGLKDKIESDLKDTVNDSVGKSESFVLEELRKATAAINGMMGNSYVIYDGDKILVLDKLPKEEAKNVIMINSGGIGFSDTGIDGTFNSAWLIDGTLDMSKINVMNLKADYISSGTLDASKISVKDLKAQGVDVSGKLTATTLIVSDTAQVSGLEVGKNVKMAEDAVIGWGNLPNDVASDGDINIAVSDKVSAREVTIITKNAIETGDLILWGKIYGKLEDATGDNDTQYILGVNNNNNLQLGGVNASYKNINVYSKGQINFISQGSTAEDYDLRIGTSGNYVKGGLYVDGSQVITNNTIGNHSHSQYYENGDAAYFSRVYISGASTATSGAANARLAQSSPYQLMYAASSTRRVKHDVKLVENPELDPERLYDIEVVQFKYNNDHISETDQRYDKDCIGFIAEQVAEVYPIAADMETGEPSNWDSRYIIPPMLKLIQDQKKEIDELKERLSTIERKVVQ